MSKARRKKNSFVPHRLRDRVSSRKGGNCFKKSGLQWMKDYNDKWCCDSNETVVR